MRAGGYGPTVRAEQRVAAHGVLVAPDGSIALVRASDRGPDAGRWRLPGGAVRHGEHPRETARRAASEELGFAVEVTRVRDAAADVLDLSERAVSVHTVRLVYDLQASADWWEHIPILEEDAPGVPSDAEPTGAAPILAPAPSVAAVPTGQLGRVQLARFTAHALGLVPDGSRFPPPIRPVDARVVEVPVDGGPPKVQRVGAYAVVPDAGRLLLARYVASGRWSLPGGGIDHGEQPREALHREVHEETGLALADVRLADVDSVHFTGHAPDGTLEDFHAVRIVYRATVPPDAEPAVIEVDGSSDAAAWIPLDQLDRYPVTGFVGVALRLLG